MPSSMHPKLNFFSTLAALGIFFLPWLEIQCSREPMATQSGLQAIYGGATLSDPSAAARQKEKSTDPDDSLGTAWPLALALLAILGAVGVSFRALSRPAGEFSAMPGGLCALALAALVFQLQTGFPAEKKFAPPPEKPPAQTQSGLLDALGDSLARGALAAIEVRRLPAIHYEIAVLALPALLLASRIIGRKIR